MNRLEHRVRTLEQKQNGNGPVVFVFPSTATPEHEFHSDEAYYQDLAKRRYGRDDFKLALWPVGETRTDPELLFIDDPAKLLSDIPKNSTRAGVEVPKPCSGGK